MNRQPRADRVTPANAAALCPRCRKPIDQVDFPTGKGMFALAIRDCCGDVFTVTAEGPQALKPAHLVTAHLLDSEGFENFLKKLGMVHLRLLIDEIPEEAIPENSNASHESH